MLASMIKKHPKKMGIKPEKHHFLEIEMNGTLQTPRGEDA